MGPFVVQLQEIVVVSHSSSCFVPYVTHFSSCFGPRRFARFEVRPFISPIHKVMSRGGGDPC